MIRAATAFIDVVGDFSGYERGLQGAQGSLGAFGKSNQQVAQESERSFGSAAKSALKWAAGLAATYGAVSKAREAISVTQDLSKATEQLHRNLGLSIKEASRWAAVAKVRGIEGTALATSFNSIAVNVDKAVKAEHGHIQSLSDLHRIQKKLSPSNQKLLEQALHAKTGSYEQAKAIAELTKKADNLGTAEKQVLTSAIKAQDAASKQAEAYRKLGITHKDLIRGSHDFDFLLTKLATGFGKLKGGTERQAIAQQVLGRGWKTLLPLFAEGNKSLQQQLHLADKYHVTLSGKTIKSMGELTRAQREAKFAMLGLQVTFAQKLAPTLIKGEKVAGKFISTLTDPKLSSEERWAKIDTIISNVIGGMASGMDKAIPKIADSAAKQAPQVAKAFVTGFENAGAWGKLAIGYWLLRKMGGVRAVAASGRAAGATWSRAFTSSASAGEGVTALMGAGAAGAGGAVGAAGGAGAISRESGPQRGGQLIYGSQFRYGAPVSQLGERRSAFNFLKRLPLSSKAALLGLPFGTQAALALLAGAGASKGLDALQPSGSKFDLPTRQSHFGKLLSSYVPGVDKSSGVTGGFGIATDIQRAGEYAKKLQDLMKHHDAQGLVKGAKELQVALYEARKAGADPSLIKHLQAARDAFRDGAHEADKFGVNAIKAFPSKTRFHSEEGLFREMEGRFKHLSGAGRKAGAEAMIEMSRSLERQDKLPKGATKKLIHDIERQYPGLVASLKRSGHDSVKALNTALQDRRVVKTVQRQVNQIGKTWDDAPKLAKTNASNARSNWQREMDFLKEKIRTSTGRQKEIAQKQWRRLAGSADETARTASHAFEREMPKITTAIRSMVHSSSPLISGLGRGVSALIRGPGRPTGRELEGRGGFKGGPGDPRLPAMAAGGVVQPGSAWGRGDRFHRVLTGMEHVIPEPEVKAAGGHEGVYAWRRSLRKPTRHMQTGGAVDRVNVAPLAADARGLAKVPELFKKTRDGAKKHLLDLKGDSSKTFKDIDDDGEKQTKKLHKSVGDEQRDLLRDSKRSGDKFAKNTDSAFSDATSSGKKRTTQLRKAVGDRFDDIVHDTTSSMRKVDKTVASRFSSVVHTGNQRGAQFSRGMGSTMRSTDSAVYSGLSYIASATNASLRSFGAKPVGLSIAKPHARGGIPNPAGSARDDHVLYSPQGQPVAALSGSEGIVNTPQMGVINQALGVAKRMGASAWGSLGELWGSGMTHYAKGGKLPRFAKGGGMSHWARLVAAANQVDARHFGYSWGGGHEQPARLEPFDCSGAVSYAVQHAGYHVPTTVSGNMGSWGFPRGAGAATIFYNPEHTWMQIGNRAWGTSGSNPGGGAGWFSVPDAGYKGGFSSVHLPDIGHAGDFGGIDIKRPVVKGPDGKPRRIAQGAIDMSRKAAIHYAQKKFNEQDPGSGQALNDLPKGGWARVGATREGLIGGVTSTGHHITGNEMSFAELLVAGANSGMWRQDLAATLGLPNRQGYGMPAGTKIKIRKPGAKTAYVIDKFDIGSGQGGNSHYKIDLAEGIIRKLGWTGNQDVEVHRRLGGLLGKRRLPRFAAGGPLQAARDSAWMHRARLIWRSLNDRYFHDFGAGMPHISVGGGTGYVTFSGGVPRAIHIPGVTPDGLMRGDGEDEVELIHEFAHSEQRGIGDVESDAESFAHHAAAHIDPYRGFNHGSGASWAYGRSSAGTDWLYRDEFVHGRAKPPRKKHHGHKHHGGGSGQSLADQAFGQSSGSGANVPRGNPGPSHFSGKQSRFDPFSGKWEKMTDNRWRAILRKWYSKHPTLGIPTGRAQQKHFNPFSGRFELMGSKFWHELVRRWQKKHGYTPIPKGPGAAGPIHHHDQATGPGGVDLSDQYTMLDADEALAALTPGTGDDLAAINRKIRIDQHQFRQAKKAHNNAAITEWAGNLKSDLDTRKEINAAAAESQAALAESNKELAGELRALRKTFASVEGVSHMEAVRALSDVISGQIAGFGVAPRAASAGSGAIARY